MKPIPKTERSSQEQKVPPGKMLRDIVCPICGAGVPYSKRGVHRCLRVYFHEMTTKIQKGLW